MASKLPYLLSTWPRLTHPNRSRRPLLQLSAPTVTDHIYPLFGRGWLSPRNFTGAQMSSLLIRMFIINMPLKPKRIILASASMAWRDNEDEHDGHELHLKHTPAIAPFSVPFLFCFPNSPLWSYPQLSPPSRVHAECYPCAPDRPRSCVRVLSSFTNVLGNRNVVTLLLICCFITLP